MRIGISTSLMQRGRSGAGQYLFCLLRALLRHAPEHEYFLFALEHDAPLFGFCRHTVRVATVSEEYRPPLKDFAWHQTVLPRLVRELGLDVLHVPSHRRMLWPRPCALVTTVCDTGALRAAGGRMLRALSRSAVYRRLLRRQDAVVAVTAATADGVIEAAGVPPERVTVIPVGVDHERFQPDRPGRAAARIAQRYGVRPPFFIYVARLDTAKNHPRLIQAFNAFKTTSPSPWQLVLVGGDGRGAERIRQEVRRSPYAPDIYCPGFVPADDLPDWYRAAGALVYPTLRHGYSLPVLEAMACGCPVLAPSTGPAAAVCGNAGVLVDPRDQAALRHEMARLALDAGLRSRLRDAGLARAAGFDWERAAAATLDVYARAACRVRTAELAAPAVPRAAH